MPLLTHLAHGKALCALEELGSGAYDGLVETVDICAAYDCDITVIAGGVQAAKGQLVPVN